MNDPENFLERWSRRKRETETDERQPVDSPSTEPAVDAGSQPPSAGATSAEPLVDLSRLPAIESITADTDIRGFFAPGVPADLKLAALRRAWVADPKIRDFIEVADYDFDFHTPGAIPGFGPLEMTDDLRREVARIAGQLLQDDAPAQTEANGSPQVVDPPVQSTVATEEIDAGIQPEETTAGAASRFPPDEPGHQRENTQSRFAALQGPQDFAAPQHDNEAAENLQTPARRTHGGALPK